jgi:hypothetical protein
MHAALYYNNPMPVRDGDLNIGEATEDVYNWFIFPSFDELTYGISIVLF